MRAVFSAPQNRIIVRRSAAEAKSALTRGAFDAVVLYAEGADHAEEVNGVTMDQEAPRATVGEIARALREIRELAPHISLVVVSPKYAPELESTAFEQGADLYFSEPIPTQTLTRILTNQRSFDLPPGASVAPERTERSPERPVNDGHAAPTLHVLRDLSHILSFSLDYKAFTRHFILKLRDHISFSRMAIFLESSAKQSLVKNKRSKHLTCVASLGLPSDLVDCFQLSREVGIGRELSVHPRILHKGGHSQASFQNLQQGSNAVDKEFSVLGCHLAIPITDREDAIGLALLSGPVTGRDYNEDELELLYLLMEELGMAIRNSRLHSELAQHGQLIENVMHSMSSGALVFSEELDILYINDAAKRFLGIGLTPPDRTVEFAELPSKLTTPVHRAVEKGELPEPFKIAGLRKDDIYQVSLFPFIQKGELMLLPRPTMVILEDITQIEASQETALADSKTEIIRLIAERFAHEIRNSLVPLSTHAQLIDKKIDQPKFQASLKSAMLKETARIKRFSEQMLYLAQSSQTGGTELRIADIIESAYERARQHVGHSRVRLEIDNEAGQAELEANPEALTYAFEELFLNSMQAEPGEQTIRVQIRRNHEGILCLRWRDGGPGLSPEVIQKATEPFYTTRNTGVGLGLSIADKVVSEHHGFLRLNSRTEERDWDVGIELPSLLTHA